MSVRSLFRVPGLAEMSARVDSTEQAGADESPYTLRGFERIVAAHGHMDASGAERNVLKHLAWIFRRSIFAVLTLSLCAGTGLITSVIVCARLFSGDLTLTRIVWTAFAFLALEGLAAWLLYVAYRFSAQLYAAAKTVLFEGLNRRIAEASYQEITQSLSQGRVGTLAAVDFETVAQFFAVLAHNALPSLTLSLVFSVFLVVKLGILGVIVVAVSLAEIPLSLWISRAIPGLRDQALHSLEQVNQGVAEWYQKVRLVRALQVEALLWQRIVNHYRTHVSFITREHLLSILMFTLSYCWWTFPAVLLIVLPEFFPSMPRRSDLIVSLWMIFTLSAYLKRLPGALHLFQAAFASARRIGGTFREIRRTEPQAAVQDEEALAIRLSDATFVINDKTIIERVSETISLREKSVVVGDMASGKTSLALLCLGFLTPTSGRVEVITNRGVHACSSPRGRALLRSAIAYSPQQPFLMDDTLASNICGAGTMDVSLTMYCVEAAELIPDLQQLAHGLESSVGLDGSQLSGGQRLRLALARALYERKPFLLLDDPLSGLDAEVASRIISRLNALPISICIFSQSRPVGFQAASAHRLAQGRLQTVVAPQEGADA